MKFYSTVFLLSLLTVSCSKSKQTETKLLLEAQNYNNSRAYAKTIDLLENSGQLTISQQKELIYAYAGSAGIEAITLKNQMTSIEKIMSNEELSPVGKVNEIIDILPKQNKEKIKRLNLAIDLFVKLQSQQHLLDADSKFQLGVLYFYRSVYTLNLILDFSDEGIAQTLEEKVSEEEFNNLLSFFNSNMGNALGDLKKSYDQLLNSYSKIQKIALQVDKNVNYFLSDDVFKDALNKKFTNLTDLYKAYFKDISANYNVYFKSLDKLGEAIGLERSFQDIFQEFSENPEKVKRVLSRVEVMINMFIESSKDMHSEEYKYFESIFPKEIKEELKIKIAESWRAKNTDAIVIWFNNHDGKIQKLKDFIKLVLSEGKKSGLEQSINREAQILIDMIDREALKKFGHDLDAFSSQGEAVAIELDVANQQVTHIYAQEIEKANNDMKEMIDSKLQKYHEDTENDERVEFNDDDRNEINESIQKAEKAIEY